MEKLENRLDDLGRQDDPGAVGKDQDISMGGDGEVGPHEAANGGLGAHRFGPGGFSNYNNYSKALELNCCIIVLSASQGTRTSHDEALGAV